MKIAKIFKNLAKALFLFIAVVFIRGVIAINNSDISIAAVPQTATLFFNPEQVYAKQSDIFKIDVNLATGDQSIVGADIVINFDNNNTELINISHTQNSSLKTFVPLNKNKSFDTSTVLNRSNEIGTISLGAVTYDINSSKKTEAFNGETYGLFTLTFKIKETAADIIKPISFYYDSDGSKADSNIISGSSIEHAQDILQKPSSFVVIN